MTRQAVPYPLAGFRFKVEFSGKNTDMDMSFREVGGLKMQFETEDMREGGEYAFTYRLPVRVKQPNLVLKRGLLKGSELSRWVRDALEDFKIRPLLVTISLLGEDGQPLMVWQAHQAWPVSWEIGGLNAMQNEVIVETLELAYAHLRFQK